MFIKFEGIIEVPDIFLIKRNKRDIIENAGVILSKFLASNFYLHKLTLMPMHTETMFVPDTDEDWAEYIDDEDEDEEDWYDDNDNESYI